MLVVYWLAALRPNEYQYTFLPGKTFRGVMADEVKEVMPEAVFTDSKGFMAVNYGMIGAEMVEV